MSCRRVEDIVRFLLALEADLKYDRSNMGIACAMLAEKLLDKFAGVDSCDIEAVQKLLEGRRK